METKNINIKYIVTAFVVLLVAIAFLTSIADQTQGVTAKTNIADETEDLSTSCYTAADIVNETNSACNYTVTYKPTSWKIADCPLTNVVVTNKTGTALTLDTDYHLFASTGIIQFLNTAATNSTNLGDEAKIDYTYCSDSYMNTSWGRTVLNTNAGMYAIAILIIVVGLVMYLLKRKEDY